MIVVDLLRGEELALNRVNRCLISVAVTILSLSLCDCTQFRSYYENTTADPHHSVRSTLEYSLAFIEFGEQGSYQDPSQLKNALDLIKSTSRPLVITYVHGWHNNAGSADVGRFSQWLSEVSQTQLIRSSGFHLIGVYLGWRGEITNAPIVRQLTNFL
jgi:hypothetical protein